MVKPVVKPPHQQPPGVWRLRHGAPRSAVTPVPEGESSTGTRCLPAGPWTFDLPRHGQKMPTVVLVGFVCYLLELYKLILYNYIWGFGLFQPTK